MNRRLVLLSLVPGVLAARAWSQGVDPAARDVALLFLRGLEHGDLRQLYATQMTPLFRSATPEALFVDQVAIGRVQAGGAAQSRVLVGGQPFTRLPTGQTGDYYYVRFVVQFPSLPRLFQDVYLERVAGIWRVGGFQVLPAPPQ